MDTYSFSPPSHPAALILDTDIATDCDDAGAIAVLHALVSAGEARIHSVVVNNKDPDSVGAVAALNAFYGRNTIPIGAYPGDAIGATAGEFVRVLAADTARYGHTICTRADVPSSTEVYRRTLAGLPDGQAVIASIGHLNNLHDLLLSQADVHSPLSGPDLIRLKVAHVVVMGGDYPQGKEHNFFARGSDAISAAVVAHWPTPILFSGFTLGQTLPTGRGLTALPEEHPVRRAYALHPAKPLENGRPSWDQTAIIAAIRGPSVFWDLGPRGFNRIAADGSNRWETDPQGTHSYLIEKTSPEVVCAEIETLMLGC